MLYGMVVFEPRAGAGDGLCLDDLLHLLDLAKEGVDAEDAAGIDQDLREDEEHRLVDQSSVLSTKRY